MQHVLSVLVLAILTAVTQGRIEYIPLPGGLQDCFNSFSERTAITDTVGESIAAFCFDQYIWKAARDHGWKGFNMTRQAYMWANNLLKKSDFRRQKRQARSQRRVRKEYRRLTDEERANYHRAIQLLKADTSILPNRYDALSAIHQGIVTTSAHGGPNFLPFHRVYVLMFENALREMVPGVTVPYWDSTLDEALPDPTQSVLFTETFLGDGFGIVETGPFAHWNTLSGPLTRNIGQSGQLFKPEDITRITTRLRLAEITEPNAPINSSLEFHHNEVHLWIDGQMGSLNTAAHDPVFWVHHAYVDYVWEQFRRHQRASGVDPTRDYPTFVNDSMHHAGVPMGLSNFRNIDGLSEMFTGFYYTYEPSPTCSQRFPNCGSPYLRCVLYNGRPRCISADRTAAPMPSPLLMGFGMGGAAMSLMAAVRNQQIQAFQQQQLQQSMAMRQNLLNIARMRQAAASSQMAPVQNFMMNAQPQMSPQAMTPQMGLTGMQGGIQGGMQGGMQGQSQVFGEQENSEGEEGGGGGKRRKRYAKKKSAAIVVQSRPMRQAIKQPAPNLPAPMPMQSRNVPVSNVINAFQTPVRMQGRNQQSLNQMNTLQQMGHFPNFSSPMMFSSPNMNTCPSIPMSHGYQNTFNINGQSDIGQWVYIPVKVVFQRPTTFRTYSSFPVVNGEPDEEYDIYSPNSQMHIKNYFAAGKPAFYSKCTGKGSGAGKVYVNSQGINYMGNYKEYAIVDHRLAVSISTAYVAVKSPEFGATEVFLSAYDTCGRICQPYCKMAGVPGVQRCSGAFRITSDSPKLYGTNYGEAVSNLWQFNEGGGCPLLSQDNVYIQFYCNFRDSWPFSMSGAPQQAPTMQQQAPQMHKPPQSVPDDLEPAEQKSNANNSIVAACNIGHGCIITGSCSKCQEGRLYACAGLCSLYTSCQNGIHYKRTCQKGTWFNPDEGMCVPGQCMDRPFQWWYRQQASSPDIKK